MCIGNRRATNPVAGRNCSSRLNRNHLEGMHFAILVADRHILADVEGVAAEPVTGLVVLVGGIVVVEDLPRNLGAAGFVDQLADFLPAS